MFSRTSLRESSPFSHIHRGTSTLNFHYTLLQNIVLLVLKPFQWAVGLIHDPDHFHVFHMPVAPSAGAKGRASWHPSAQSHPENGIKWGLWGNLEDLKFKVNSRVLFISREVIPVSRKLPCCLLAQGKLWTLILAQLFGSNALSLMRRK